MGRGGELKEELELFQWTPIFAELEPGENKAFGLRERGAHSAENDRAIRLSQQRRAIAEFETPATVLQFRWPIPAGSRAIGRRSHQGGMVQALHAQ
jgi:hypothetical protein